MRKEVFVISLSEIKRKCPLTLEDLVKLEDFIIATGASELVSEYGGEGVGIQLFNERPERAFYIVEEESSKTEEIEKRIEAKYPMCRLESYNSKKKTHGHYLRLYNVMRPVFKKAAEKIHKPDF